MKIKISVILTIAAFAILIYLGVMKFVYEQEVHRNLLILAAIMAVLSSVLRRRGK